MDYHHVVEAAGVVSLGLIFYSYAFRWFEAGPAAWRRWRPVVTGLAFGGLTVVMMISRIQVAPDRYVDARAVPIALVTLVEGWLAGGLAAALAVAYRLYQGGSGALAGVLGIVATAAAAAVIRAWAHRDGRVALRHSLVLSVIVWVITAISFLSLGERGAVLFTPLWLPFLVLSVVGIGGGARLFADVVAGHAVQAARRDAAQLRAVTLLARAAAHEINNPLTAVMGGLGLVARKLPPGSEELAWVKTARDGSERIRDIVARMNRITQIEETVEKGALPPMLDIRKSSGPS
jgi:signal transduction histidine kinase